MVVQSVVGFAVADHQTLKYNGYKYPVWAEYIGWSLTLSSILMIPIVGAYQLYKAPCSSFKDVNCSFNLKYCKSKHNFVLFCFFRN